MKTRRNLTSTQLLIIGLLGITLACLAGVLNGVYTLGQLASDTDILGASIVAVKVERAALYGYAALACTALSFVLILVECLRRSQPAN